MMRLWRQKSGQWPEVLDRLGKLLSSECVGLYIQDNNTDQVQSPCLIGIDDVYIRSYDKYFVKVNPWFNAGLMKPGKVVTDRDIDLFYNEPGRYLKTEFYNDWLKEQGFRYVMGGTLQAENNIFINVTYFRSKSAGCFTDEDINCHKLFVPHLQKSLEMSQRIDRINITELASEVNINRLSSGVVVLGESGRVVHSNNIAKNILNENNGLIIKNQKVVATKPADNRTLQTKIRKSLYSRKRKISIEPFHLIVTRPDGRKPYQVTGLPAVNNKMLFTLESPALIILLTKQDEVSNVDTEYWRIRHKFTDTEVSLATLLVQGSSVKDAANQLNISYGTARWHLRSIFQKTGVHRQSELVSLLLTDDGADF